MSLVPDFEEIGPVSDLSVEIGWYPLSASFPSNKETHASVYSYDLFRHFWKSSNTLFLSVKSDSIFWQSV